MADREFSPRLSLTQVYSFRIRSRTRGELPREEPEASGPNRPKVSSPRVSFWVVRVDFDFANGDFVELSAGWTYRKPRPRQVERGEGAESSSWSLSRELRSSYIPLTFQLQPTV